MSVRQTDENIAPLSDGEAGKRSIEKEIAGRMPISESLFFQVRFPISGTPASPEMHRGTALELLPGKEIDFRTNPLLNRDDGRLSSRKQTLLLS